MYEIIYSDEIKRKLETEFGNTNDNLQIITAYCKTTALSYVDAQLNNKAINKRLMVRFQLEDLLSGASDFDVFKYCCENGWELYIRLDLHAKTFIFDRKRWIVGSANLTSSGIGLAADSNMEMAVLTDVDAGEMVKINNLFDKATPMDERLHTLMARQIEKIKNGGKNMQWDDEILDLLQNDVAVLFTHDFPKSHSPKNLYAEDLVMLKLSGQDTSLPVIKEAFMQSDCYRWLKGVLDVSNGKELYFGSLSEKLHNTLVNDPKPYRKEVKELLANLINWVIELEIEEIVVERPNYSQLVKLV